MNNEAMYTVWFDNGVEGSEMPQDFETYSEAKEYAEEIIARN